MIRSTPVVCVAVILLNTTTADGQSIYETSFESPFSLGSINGQGNWLNSSGSGSSHSIIDTFARTGTQSIQWDNTSLNAFYSVRRPFAGLDGAINPSTPLEISTWLYIDPSTDANRMYGLYAMNNSTHSLGGTNMGITVSGNGSVRTGNEWEYTYLNTPSFSSDDLVGAWIQLVLTYDGTSASASIYNASYSKVFSEDINGVNLTNANGLADWGVNLGSDWNGPSRLGLAYMDDFSVRLVPSPASMLAIGAGLLFAARRRL